MIFDYIEYKIKISALIFDLMINKVDNFDEIKENYIELENELGREYAQFVFLDNFAAAIKEDYNEENLKVLDRIYNEIFGLTDNILPLELLKEDIKVNLNAKGQPVKVLADFNSKALEEADLADCMKYYFARKTIRALLINSYFMKAEYKDLYKKAMQIYNNHVTNELLVEHAKKINYFNV